MPDPRFEVPSGPIDGANRDFRVSVPYKPGTTAYFLNGELKRPTFEDSWAETDPATGLITVNEAPLEGDVVQFFFVDTSPALPGVEIENLYGTLSEVDAVAGTLAEIEALTGTLSDCP